MDHTRRKFDLRALFIMLMDALCVAVAMAVALWVRFDFSINQVPGPSKVVRAQRGCEHKL